MEDVRRLAGRGDKIDVILCDIDDTLTSGGRLQREAFSALWDLKDAGKTVIPVTGRPAGWCDMIVRQWPVDAVVGENGAFVYYLDDRGVRRSEEHPAADGEYSRRRLEAVKEEVLRRVEGSRISRDQFTRLYDLAIDFAEEKPELGLEAARRIASICRSMGAVAKISSIHVNAWFGDYDKLSMSRRYLTGSLGISAERLGESVLFCGDSPNDEPMFAAFPLSVGVANIADFADDLEHPPAYVTRERGGRGFAELVRVLLGGE